MLYLPVEEIQLEKYCWENSVFNREQVFQAEQTLIENPGDIFLRARLLYTYFQHNLLENLELDLSKARSIHLFWFIEQLPDWKFCGTKFFYLSKEDNYFDKLKKLWLKKVAESGNLGRRVNAYMLLASQSDPNLETYFEKFFKGYENNIWVQALADLNLGQSSWFDEIIEIDRRKRDLDDGFCAEFLTLIEQTNWKHLVYKATKNCILKEYQIAVENFFFTPSLGNLCLIAGYSWTRWSSYSILHCDPKLISDRFLIACWIVRNIPSSRLAKELFFMSPFIQSISEEKRDYLEIPIRYLSSLWISQLEKSPEDLKICKNAAFFSKRIEISFPEISLTIVRKLKVSNSGKKALKSSRY